MKHTDDLTQNSFNTSRIFLGLFSFVMIAVSIYLTHHYFEAHFPTSLVSGSMCDISSFWNCDTAVFSKFSSLYYVPTSVFGIVVGFIFFLDFLFAHSSLQKANCTLAFVNALGCIGLFFYSLLVLNGLCPGCTLYYACSLGVLGVYWLKGDFKFSFLPKTFGLYLAIFLLIAGGFHFYTKDLELKNSEGIETSLKEFRKSQDYEVFGVTSPFRLASASENFADAPLRVSLFSDFQCPVCKVFSEEILPKLLKFYEGKINFQYFFYPMDSNCNHNISQPMHPMACEASYLASCSSDNFKLIHDLIYEKQNTLSNSVLQKLANDQNISTCFHSLEAKNTVEDMILAGDKLGVQATPTLIINGRKLEGLLPLKYMILFFDDALKERSS